MKKWWLWHKKADLCSCGPSWPGKHWQMTCWRWQSLARADSDADLAPPVVGPQLLIPAPSCPSPASHTTIQTSDQSEWVAASGGRRWTNKEAGVMRAIARFLWLGNDQVNCVAFVQLHHRALLQPNEILYLKELDISRTYSRPHSWIGEKMCGPHIFSPLHENFKRVYSWGQMNPFMHRNCCAKGFFSKILILQGFFGPKNTYLINEQDFKKVIFLDKNSSLINMNWC